MFDTKEKIFVIMEKMNGDMLEMILTQVIIFKLIYFFRLQGD